MQENKKEQTLGVKDIVLLNVIAILSLRQISNVALYGASAMLLWLLAAACLFLPMALICSELSSGWNKNGGIFVWIKAAFGKRTAWIVLICMLFSSLCFFPLMLQFGLTVLGYLFDINQANDKWLIGIGSIVLFWIMTLFNLRGIQWTKRLNSLSAWWGVFIPIGILVLLAGVWLLMGKPMATDYVSRSAWLPDFSRWNTIVFLSSMMFAFAGFELAPMLAGKVAEPQRNFPRAIGISALLIVSVYMLGTWAVNVLWPAEDTDIVVGIMQAIQGGADLLQVPWLVPLMGILMFIGVIGQINSWLIAPMYMLQGAVKEDQLLGRRFSELHSKYGTPVYGLLLQGVIVSVLSLYVFISEDLDTIYWTLAALTSLTYFVPHLVLFPAYYRLHVTRMDIQRRFKIPGRFIPFFLPLLGFISVVLAIVLLFIPPAELNIGSYFRYAGVLIGGLLTAIFLAEWLYHRAAKRQRTSPSRSG